VTAPPSFHHDDFDALDLVEHKGATAISVCLPARNEADTVGPIVSTIRAELLDRLGLVDEIIVVDDHSDDDTARIAAEAGARVVAADLVLAEFGEGHGKGEALWKSLFVAKGDIVVWCDADVANFSAGFVVGLLGPLLTRPEIAFVKGYYDRPSEGVTGGGRVTELVGRPILSLLFPHLAEIVQPLGGEYAGRREVLEQLPFVQGYGVELGLLVDVVGLVGIDAIAQVDLGTRIHRNRPLDELSPQALAVLATALHRADRDRDPQLIERSIDLHRPGRAPITVDVGERPPLVTVDAYRRDGQPNATPDLDAG
jgi:glucosyl-3-phosphoglycerate synthase